MSFVIGVDAGASHTRAAVASSDGKILGRGEGGPGRVRPGDSTGSAVAILTAARDALEKAGVAEPVRALVAGASGVGHRIEREALASKLEMSTIAEKTLVTTDAEIALEDAHGASAGIVLIAGTGSVAWGRLPDGSMSRAGGFGPVLGDRGSGHDLAREALRAVGVDLELELHLDLTQRIAKHLGVSLDDLPRWSLAADVAGIAALAPVILDSARAGDTVAFAIARHCARQLAALVVEMADRFPPGAIIDVGWGGGLLSHDDYRSLVKRDIEEFVPAVRFRKKHVDGAAGAVAIARRLL